MPVIISVVTHGRRPKRSPICGASPQPLKRREGEKRGGLIDHLAHRAYSIDTHF